MISINKSKKKKVIILILVLSIALLSILLLLELFGITNFVKQTQDHQQERSAPTAEEVKRQTSTDNNKKKIYIENSTNRSTTLPPDAMEPVELSSRQEGSTIIISTKLQGISDGECSLSINNGSQMKTFSASVLYQPEFSICEGYSVALSELGAGNWNFKLTVKDLTGDTFTATSSLETR